MSEPSQKKPSGGMSGALFVLCLAMAAVGLGLDFAPLQRAIPFWVGDGPGGGAALGAASVLFVALAGYGARFLIKRGAKGDGDVRPHA